MLKRTQEGQERGRRAANLWTARIIPIVLAGVVGKSLEVAVVTTLSTNASSHSILSKLFPLDQELIPHCPTGYATYVTVALLCGELTHFFCRVVLMRIFIVNYLLIKHKDKGAAIPILAVYFILFVLMTSSFLRVTYTTTFDPAYLPLGPDAKRKRNIEKGKGKGIKDFTAGEEYTSGESAHSKDDPDSPGLELFYTKDVFVAEMDGRPRWCIECANWKPDRTHHCSASGRCIYKMDHYCPW